METIEATRKQVNHGANSRKVRRSLDIKQAAFGEMVGMSQQTISDYEKKKEIEDHTLEKFAEALKCPVSLLKEMEEEGSTVIFENNSNTFGDNEKINQGYYVEDSSTNHYNPIDKIAELFERLLEKEQEKIALLEKLLKGK